GDVEAEPDPAGAALAVALQLGEAVEDPLPLGLGDARAGVLDGQDRLGPPPRRPGPPAGKALQALSSRLPRTCTTASWATRTGRDPLVSIAIRRSWGRARGAARARGGGAG